jgi:hypothetical protein
VAHFDGADIEKRTAFGGGIKVVSCRYVLVRLPENQQRLSASTF